MLHRSLSDVVAPGWGGRAFARVLRVALVAGAATLLASPSVALAAVVSGPDYEPTFTAGPGETNNLRVTSGPDGVTHFDDDVPITTTSPTCEVALGNVSCASPVPTPFFFQVVIDLGDGEDETTLGTIEHVTQYGGSGNDHLRGSTGVSHTYGGDGDDRLDAGVGLDGASILYGDDGNDILTASPARGTYAIMDGGTGGDTFVAGAEDAGVDYWLRSAPITASIDGVANDGEEGEHDNIGIGIHGIAGGDASNTLSGGSGDESLLGGPADDRLLGGGGDDSLLGGDGDDILGGGDGDDSLFGEVGADDLRGGAGEDRAFELQAEYWVPENKSVTLDDLANDGSAGERDNVRSDVEDVETGSGDDDVSGSAEENDILTGDGADVVDGAGGADVIDSAGGDDTIRARDGATDVVSCGPDTDIVIADVLDVVDDTCEAVDRPPPPPPPPPPPRPAPAPVDSDSDGTPDASDPCPAEDARPRDENANGCLDLLRLTPVFTLTPGRYVKLSRDRHSYVKLGVKVRQLVVRGLPAGARVRMTCTRGACTTHSMTVRRDGTLRFATMRNRKLRTGTRVVLRATMNGYIGSGVTYEARANAISKRAFCIRPDGHSGNCSTLR